MPPLGFDLARDKKPALGVLGQGASRPATGPAQRFETWTVYAGGRLALGLSPAIRRAMNPAAFRQLQIELRDRGYYSGPIDGQFGPATQAAHDRYRRSFLRRLHVWPTSRFAEAMVRVAEAEAKSGVRESGGNNRGSRVEEYLKVTGTKPGENWCAAFVCWCMRQAAKSVADFGFRLPTEAGAFRFEDWAVAAGAHGVFLLDPDGLALRRGDIVILKFSHIGLCTDDAAAEGLVRTVEGNTTPAQTGNRAAERDGGGVYLKQRPKQEVRSVVRLGSALIDTAYPAEFAYA